jgi:rare lipoprotein A
MLVGIRGVVAALAVVMVPILAGDAPAQARGAVVPVFVQQGVASWYGPGFHGRRTASGVRFNQHDLTAAHRRLPLGTRAVVTNLKNGRTVEVEINDRGPYKRGRIIDLSRGAAERLGMKDAGVMPVRVEVLEDQVKTDDQSS